MASPQQTAGQLQAFASPGDNSTERRAPPAHPGPESPSQQPRDRRREKPQLSCNFCRRRKIRCDRRLPCAVCVDKGLALSCSYTTRTQPNGAAATVAVSERLQHLEGLVLSLMSQQQQHHQQQQQEQQPPPQQNGGRLPAASLHTDLTPANDRECNVCPPPEHGTMREHSYGTNYASSVHWAAVLDSISELRRQFENEGEDENNSDFDGGGDSDGDEGEEAKRESRKHGASQSYPKPDFVRHRSAAPRLLCEPVRETKEDILASMPVRPVVDRMVARYFNGQGLVPAILHTAKFLREYENFWRDPGAQSFVWIGLLFSIVCLATQLQHPDEEMLELGLPVPICKLHERTVQCLVLGQYTRGGPYVLEALINYCANELCMSKDDADVGPWLPLGILVQLALSRGYHRDPGGFPSISPFAGEMRRRVWAAVVQMDLRLSSQLGLPHLLKSTQCSTADPRNLFDSDFDETTTELPPSRPETEVTPVLYSLARNKIDKIGGLIGDLVADVRDHPYDEILELERRLQEAEASLPTVFRWQPLSRLPSIPPQILLFGLWLQLTVLRLVIWLHRKYLSPAYSQRCYEHSRNACVRAALKILEFQLLLDDETQPGGRLRPGRWMQGTLLQSTFLLGMSILCYYVQLAKAGLPHVPLDAETRSRILDALRDTYPLWVRLSAVSADAREAAERLRRLPDLRGQLLAESPTTALAEGTGSACLATTPQGLTVPVLQSAWDTDQGTVRHDRRTKPGEHTQSRQGPS